jgi:integrase
MRKFPAAGCVELAVHATEVSLDGLAGDEQRLRDLGVAPPPAASSATRRSEAVSCSSPLASGSALGPPAARSSVQIEPELRGEPVPAPDLTLAELVDLYLERHAASVRPRTITTLRERLVHAVRAFGDVPLHDLERMPGEIATWQAQLPKRSRYGIVQALRQTLGAAVHWGYIGRNPATLAGPNRQPAPRPVRAFTRQEIDAIAAELRPAYRSLPAFAAATGLRPEEWQALERRDVDRAAGVLTVRRTVSGGEVVDLAKTAGGRRQVPLSSRARAALDELPPRVDTPLVFAAPRGGVMDLNHFRRREWAPAVEASGVATPARIYDLRSTFASEALSVGVGIHALARIMGTSVRMIERHYGTLLDGALEGIAERLDALYAAPDEQVEERH